MTGKFARALLLAALALLGAVASPPRGALADDPPPADGPAPGMGGAPGTDGSDDGGATATVLERIEKAIHKGVAWLKTQQGADGSWGDMHEKGARTYNGTTDVYPFPVGPTALALYTLLKCEVLIDDPAVKKGFDWLKKKQKEIGNAYEVSAMLLAVTATADPFKRAKDAPAGDAKDRLTGGWRTWASDLTKRLVALRAEDGWRYWGADDTNAGGKQDLSSTQFAVLALLAADRCGIPVDPAAWKGAIACATAQQSDIGPARPRAVLARSAAAPSGTPAEPADRARGFAYILGKATEAGSAVPSGGMTACGVGTLMMARYVLVKRAPKVWATLDPDAIQQSIYDGLAWLDLHWSAFENPPAPLPRWHIYYLYCVERAMDLVGAQRLGTHIWYPEMTEELLARQAAPGFWDSKNERGNAVVLDTCFALLFLHRATRGGIPFPSVTGGGDVPPTDRR